MASSIDTTKPVAGSPTTSSVRANFSAAKSEIEALQTGKADLAGPTFTGTATFATLNTATFQIDGTEVTVTPAILNALDGRVTAVEATSASNAASIASISTSVAGKADASHTHDIANVTGLQTALDGKAASSHNHTASQITDQSNINAGKVDGYDIVVDSGSPSGTDANTIYLVT